MATTTAAPSAAPASNVSNDIAALIASIQGCSRPRPVAAPPRRSQPQLSWPASARLGRPPSSSPATLPAQVGAEPGVGGANARGILNSSAATQAAMQAALAEAGRLGTADASNFLALTQTGMNNDSALARQPLQGQQDERLQTMRDNAALTTQATGPSATSSTSLAAMQPQCATAMSGGSATWRSSTWRPRSREKTSSASGTAPTRSTRRIATARCRATTRATLALRAMRWLLGSARSRTATSSGCQRGPDQLRDRDRAGVGELDQRDLQGAPGVEVRVGAVRREGGLRWPGTRTNR